MKLTTKDIGGRAGKATVVTCIDGESCEPMSHSQYLSDANAVDFGYTEDDVTMIKALPTPPPPSAEWFRYFSGAKNGLADKLLYFAVTNPGPDGRLLITIPNGFTVSEPSDCKESLMLGLAGILLLNVASCAAENEVVTIVYTGASQYLTKYIVGLKVDVPVVPSVIPWYPTSGFSVKVGDFSAISLSGFDIHAVKGSSVLRSIGGDEVHAAMLPKAMEGNTKTEVTFYLKLTNKIPSNGALVISLPTGFSLAEESCFGQKISVSDCGHPLINGGKEPCIDQLVVPQKPDISGIMWQCSRVGSKAIKLRRHSSRLSPVTLRVVFRVITSNVGGLAGRATIATCYNEENCGNVINHASYISEPKAVDFGYTKDDVKITPTVVVPTLAPTPPGGPGCPAVTRPPYPRHTMPKVHWFETLPLKNGIQESVLKFEIVNPGESGRIIVTVPDEVTIVNPSDCKEEIWTPCGVRSLDVTSCTATDQVVTILFTGTLYFTDRFHLGLKVNVPLLPVATNPAVSAVTFRFELVSADVANREQRTFDLSTGLINSVRGSSTSKKVGGDELYAVMRPGTMTKGAESYVTFYMQLTNTIHQNGALLITPPEGFSIASGVCDGPSVDVTLQKCEENGACYPETVRAIAGRHIWQCVKKGSNSISLKRIDSYDS
eukprot:Filipodium_phascolosomae@DN2794_c0_g1_i11.p1